MVNSESMDTASDGSAAARERVTQLNIAVDVGHSSAPLTAPGPCLRQLDFTGENIASTSAEFANPADGSSPPETAVTNAENPSLSAAAAAAAAAAVASSLCCSVPLVKVQEVVPSAKSRKLARKFLCLYCDRTFVTSSLRQKHVDRCHSSNQARRSSTRFQSKTPTVCIYCKKLNNTDHTLSDLFKHLVEKHPSKYFGCFECDERFSFKSHLEEHNLHTHRPNSNPTEKEDIDNDEEKLRTKHKARLKPASEKEEREESKPNLRLRKELRKQKIVVRSTKIKKSARLQKNQPNPPQQKPTKKRQKSSKPTENSTKSDNDTCVNPYPSFDAYFRVKKITDHSIDNLKISSLTFDDVFDKAFYNRIKCNIQDNLQNHIDGKLFKNEESESRISNFEKMQETSQALTENFGCDITLNAATPVVSLLSSQLGEDLESQIEYGAKASKKKITVKKDEVHYKYFTRRKYQASILESKENRDLSKLDMWTQLIVKDRQQKIINDKKTDKERIEYTKGIEYKTKIQNEQLNRILDRRGPFEDLKEEANRRLGKNVEAISDVTSILDDIFENIFIEAAIKEETEISEKKSIKLDLPDVPLYLNLKRSSEDNSDIDRSDKITLICSSQETENFEKTITPRDKNTLVELSGEWTRTRMYICAACGVRVPNMKLLLDHKNVYHPNVWVQHYEFVGNQSDLYKHLSIPGLGKVGYFESIPVTKSWKRSDARECAKCKKVCNSLGELHRHMLECGEDWSWMLARKKLKYRPFGSKSRRKRRGLVKRIIHKENSDEQRTDRKKYQVKVKPAHDGPRQRPSDAETIQRMLANLPAKRATRKLISLKDGFTRRRRTTQTDTNVKELNQQHQKTKSPKNIPQPNSIKQTKNKGLKCNPLKLRKSVRNINKVLGSKILDNNTTLRVKRKIKSAIQQEIRTRNKERQIEEAAKEIKKPSLINKVKMIGETVKNKVFGGERKPNLKSDESSVKPKRSASKHENPTEIQLNEAKKSEKRTLVKKTAHEEKEEENNPETKKQTIGSKIVRSLSLRRTKQKQNPINKSESDSNLSKKIEKEDKNGKKKSALGMIKNKLKKIRTKNITKIAQVDGSSQISDEILPFLENFHLEERLDTSDAKEHLTNACITQTDVLIGPIIEAQTFEDISSNLPQDISANPTSTKTGLEDNSITERECVPKETHCKESNKIEETSKDSKTDKRGTQTELFAEDNNTNQNNYADSVVKDSSNKSDCTLEIVIKVEAPEETDVELQIPDSEDIAKQQNSNDTNKTNKHKKRAKGLNDCIAMLTSKLQQKSDGSTENLDESETGLDLSLNGSKNNLNRLSSEENLCPFDTSKPKQPIVQNTPMAITPNLNILEHNLNPHANIIPPQLAAVVPTLQHSLHMGQIANIQNLHQPFLPLIHGLLPNFMFSNAFFAEKALAESLNRQEHVLPAKQTIKPVILNVPKLNINKHFSEHPKQSNILVENIHALPRNEEKLEQQLAVQNILQPLESMDQVDFCLPTSNNKKIEEKAKSQNSEFLAISQNEYKEEIVQAKKTKVRSSNNNDDNEGDKKTPTCQTRRSIIVVPEELVSSKEVTGEDLSVNINNSLTENVVFEKLSPKENEKKTENYVNQEVSSKIETIFGRLSSESDTLSFKTVMLNNISEKLSEDLQESEIKKMNVINKFKEVDVNIETKSPEIVIHSKPDKQIKTEGKKKQVRSIVKKFNNKIKENIDLMQVKSDVEDSRCAPKESNSDINLNCEEKSKISEENLLSTELTLPWKENTDDTVKGNIEEPTLFIEEGKNSSEEIIQESANISPIVDTPIEDLTRHAKKRITSKKKNKESTKNLEESFDTYNDYMNIDNAIDNILKSVDMKINSKMKKDLQKLDDICNFDEDSTRNSNSSKSGKKKNNKKKNKDVLDVELEFRMFLDANEPDILENKTFLESFNIKRSEEAKLNEEQKLIEINSKNETDSEDEIPLARFIKEQKIDDISRTFENIMEKELSLEAIVPQLIVEENTEKDDILPQTEEQSIAKINEEVSSSIEEIVEAVDAISSQNESSIGIKSLVIARKINNDMDEKEEHSLRSKKKKKKSVRRKPKRSLERNKVPAIMQQDQEITSESIDERQPLVEKEKEANFESVIELKVTRTTQSQKNNKGNIIAEIILPLKDIHQKDIEENSNDIIAEPNANMEQKQFVPGNPDLIQRFSPREKKAPTSDEIPYYVEDLSLLQSEFDVSIPTVTVEKIKELTLSPKSRRNNTSPANIPEMLEESVLNTTVVSSTTIEVPVKSDQAAVAVVAADKYDESVSYLALSESITQQKYVETNSNIDAISRAIEVSHNAETSLKVKELKATKSRKKKTASKSKLLISNVTEKIKCHLEVPTDDTVDTSQQTVEESKTPKSKTKSTDSENKSSIPEAFEETCHVNVLIKTPATLVNQENVESLSPTQRQEKKVIANNCSVTNTTEEIFSNNSTTTTENHSVHPTITNHAANVVSFETSEELEFKTPRPRRNKKVQKLQYRNQHKLKNNQIEEGTVDLKTQIEIHKGIPELNFEKCNNTKKSKSKRKKKDTQEKQSIIEEFVTDTTIPKSNHKTQADDEEITLLNDLDKSETIDLNIPKSRTKKKNGKLKAFENTCIMYRGSTQNEISTVDKNSIPLERLESTNFSTPKTRRKQRDLPLEAETIKVSFTREIPKDTTEGISTIQKSEDGLMPKSEKLKSRNIETKNPEVVNSTTVDDLACAVQEECKRSTFSETPSTKQDEIGNIEDNLYMQSEPLVLAKDPYEFEDTQFNEKETSFSQFPIHNETPPVISPTINEENLDFLTKALEDAIAQSDYNVNDNSKILKDNNEETKSQKTPEKKRKSPNDKKLTSPDDKKKEKKVRRSKLSSLFTDNEDSNEEVGKKARKLKISCQIFQKSNKFSTADKSKLAEEEEDSSDSNQYLQTIRKENPFQIPIIKEEIPDNEEELPDNINDHNEEPLLNCDVSEEQQHVPLVSPPDLYATPIEDTFSYEEQIEKEAEEAMGMSVEELENEIRRKIQMSNKMLDVQPPECTREETDEKQEKNDLQDTDDEIDQFYNNLRSVVDRIDAELKDNSNEPVADIFSEDGGNMQDKNESICLSCSDLGNQSMITNEELPIEESEENNLLEILEDNSVILEEKSEMTKFKRRRRKLKCNKEPIEENIAESKSLEIRVDDNSSFEQSNQFDLLQDASSKEEDHFEFQVNAESTNGINKLKIRRRKISEEMYEEKKKKRSHHKKSHNGHKKRRKHYSGDIEEKQLDEKKNEEQVVVLTPVPCNEKDQNAFDNLDREEEAINSLDDNFDEDMEIEECNMNTSIIENKLTIAESPKLLFGLYSDNNEFKTPNEMSLLDNIVEKNDVMLKNEEAVKVSDSHHDEKDRDCNESNKLNDIDDKFEEKGFEEIEDNFEETPLKAKIRCKKGKAKRGIRNRREKMPGIENLDEVYCDICNKNFTRMENLIKHKKTLTHIAKLSEIEAREAEIKAKQLDKEIKTREQSIGIADILQCEKETDQEVAKISSPFAMEQNASINLVDIINEVLDKPLNNEIIYNESFINGAVNTETKRYKSLGERKSFESDINTTYPFNNMHITNEIIPKNRNTLLTEQHITILENIVENKSTFGYIDDVTDSSNKSNFSNNTFMKPTENFVKPPQYEEISNDSSSVRNNFEEQRSRKVLNRDEALFLECCSLLKSSSEVSGFSKKSSKNVLQTFEMKPNDEPNWLEAKSLKNQPYPSNDFLISCPNTPLGDGFGEEYSNTNSNTIATDWSTKQREKEENFSLDNTSTKEPEINFSNVFPMEKKREEQYVSTENDDFEEGYEENRADEEFKGKISSKFDGLITKALKNSLQAMKKNGNKDKQQSEVTQTSITDYTVPILSKPESDLMDNKKVMTKGAMKVFEGLKVSIPTDDLDLKDLLNGSYTTKKPSESHEELECNLKEDKQNKTKNSLKNFGNCLGLKVTKKKHLSKRKEISQMKNENSKKEGHDVYDFEETLDTAEVLGSKLTDIKEFRNKEKEKKLNEPYDIEESDSESQGCLDSFGFDTRSISSYSSSSTNSSFKKPNEAGITKKKCMIMGRIFKNAFKSKVDFRDIPVADNSKMVEDYVNHLPSNQEQIEKKKLSPEEMDALFNKLLDDKLPTERKSEEIKNIEKIDEKSKEIKSKSNKTKNSTAKRKRQKHNSESTDDEFSLNKTKRNSKKKTKNTDNAINLEQELRECIGVASRKSQRTCTSGKQNVLVEYWSSDDSNFEAFLRETMSTEKPKKTEKLKKEFIPEKKKPEPTLKPPATKVEKPVRIDKVNKQGRRKSTTKAKKSDEDPEDKMLKNVKVTAETLAANRRKRPAADTLYYWSSSSEDESQDFIETKPIRDEIYDDDDDDDIPVQHGWIVGESPKKLVTMLAQAKGKKTDADTGVKEQGRKRTTV